MLISEKQLLAAVAAPPAYCPREEIPPPFTPAGRRRPAVKLSDLPAHLLLLIIYHSFPQFESIDESKDELQRKTLYWLSMSLRLVNRNFYSACSHILRSTYLPAYDSQIRPPYSSDPFPLTAPGNGASATAASSTSQSPLDMLQRETQVLDLFIAVKVREDVWADESEFHLEREEIFKDLFDLNQPKARLEDLIRHYGLREGIISLFSNSSRPQPPSSSSTDFISPTASVFRPPHPSPSPRVIQKRPQALPTLDFSTLSVSFSPRTVGVIIARGKTKRTVVEVTRENRNEKLETTAKRLVKELKLWLESEQ